MAGAVDAEGRPVMSVSDLGNPYGLCVRHSNTGSGNLSKWELQDQARTLLRNERVSACCRVVKPDQSGYMGSVTVMADSRTAWFRGVVHCGSVWTCPVCAGRIGERRREELQRAIDSAIGQGWDVALVTHTIRHRRQDDVKALLANLALARRKQTSGRRYKAIKEKYGIVGGVRALEVTHGNNGWHPHYHEIMFFSRPLSGAEMQLLKSELYALWKMACEKVGLGEPSEHHGVDVRGASKAAQYVGKWGFASELTRSSAKSLGAGRNPWQLLHDCAQGDRQAGALFVEFSKAFKGRCQLFWSRGLREALDLGELFSDEELATREEIDADDVPREIIQIRPHLWAKICRINGRGRVLHLALKGRPGELEAWLARVDDLVQLRWLIDDLAINGKIQRALGRCYGMSPELYAA